MTYRPPRVALLIETSRSYGRGVLHGVARYSRLHGPWSFMLTPGDLQQATPPMSDWRIDGIIARAPNSEAATTLVEMGLPIIFLDYPIAEINCPPEKKRFCVELISDSVGASRMAAKYLLEKKYCLIQHFPKCWP